MVFPNFQRQAHLMSGWPAEYRLSPNEDLPGHCQGIHQAPSKKILPNGTLGLKTSDLCHPEISDFIFQNMDQIGLIWTNYPCYPMFKWPVSPNGSALGPNGSAISTGSSRDRQKSLDNNGLFGISIGQRSAPFTSESVRHWYCMVMYHSR